MCIGSVRLVVEMHTKTEKKNFFYFIVRVLKYAKVQKLILSRKEVLVATWARRPVCVQIREQNHFVAMTIAMKLDIQTWIVRIMHEK